MTHSAEALADVTWLSSNHFHTLPLSADAAERGADLRARFNLRTPDALQTVAALSAGCEVPFTGSRTRSHVTADLSDTMSSLALRRGAEHPMRREQ